MWYTALVVTNAVGFSRFRSQPERADYAANTVLTAMVAWVISL